MQFRRDIILAAALAAMHGVTLAALAAGSVQAAPDSSSSAAAMTAPLAAHASALVAWKPRAWQAPGAGALTAAGLRVAIDPVDGTLGMPMAGALSPESFVADDAPVKLTLRANGSGRAELDERWADFAVVQLDSHGLPVWTCVHGSSGAARFMELALVPCPGTVTPEALVRVEK